MLDWHKILLTLCSLYNLFILNKFNSMEFYIFCDESCHTSSKLEKFMWFGAVCCPKEKIESYKEEIKAIKKKFNANAELKFTKITLKRIEFYEEIIDWMFLKNDLTFRTLLVENADKLDHQKYNEWSSDMFYYKMQYQLLHQYLEPKKSFNILLDIKDTQWGKKLLELKKILAHSASIKWMHFINSKESVFIQLADFLIGLVVYKARWLQTNQAKLRLINKIEASCWSLDKKTALSVKKFNRFVFTPDFK